LFRQATTPLFSARFSRTLLFTLLDSHMLWRCSGGSCKRAWMPPFFSF
jgi:hypothetical protein